MRVKDAVGRFGEQLATDHLVRAGLEVLDRNWRCRDGELDLVLRDGPALVFVEVKTRSSTAYGTPAEAVDRRKAARIRRLALRWMDEHREALGAVRLGPLRRGGRRARAGHGCARRASERSILMALACALAVTLAGLDGQLVEVQCDIAAGLPGLYFTGLPDASVSESRDRLRAAVQNTGAEWPNRRITVALLPADVRKVGSRFDLAVCLAVLGAAGAVPADAVRSAVWLAELGLDGRLRPVRGVLPSVLAARAAGVRRVVVAASNAAEAALVDGVDVRTAGHLGDIVAWLTGDGPPLELAVPPPDTADTGVQPDLADVAGQHLAKRAVEVAAAGGHHVFLLGVPGAGKTMLAERMPGLLPPLTDAEALEVTAVHSVAGLLGDGGVLVRRPPLQAPHHTASIAALVGGGSYLARPGAISIAHRGVLFLDEAHEFAPRALDALRQPLETGTVVLHRGGGAVRYPARFQLVLAANPCACALPPNECECPPQARRRHLQRLSGPLLDRVDLRVQVDAVPHTDLLSDEPRQSTAEVAARVALARSRALARWSATPYRCNADVPGSVLRAEPWRLDARSVRELDEYLQRGRVSARGYDRVLRLSWTLADLDGADRPDARHVGEALYFRTGQVDTCAA